MQELEVVAKDLTIIMRVDSETKRALEDAASQRGVTLTTFVLDAALKSASASVKAQAARDSKPAVRGRFTGVPTWFRARCAEASRGGSTGYTDAARSLARVLDRESPYDVDDQEWADELAGLNKIVSERDDDAVWEWFERHYPKCVALVPKRRKAQFVAGVYVAAAEDDPEWLNWWPHDPTEK